MKRLRIVTWTVAAGVLVVVGWMAMETLTWPRNTAAAMPPDAKGDKTYRSPQEVAFSPDGKWLAAADRTAGVVALSADPFKKVSAEVKLSGEPGGVAFGPDGRLYAAEQGAGTVAEIDVSQGKILRRLAAGPRPAGVAVAGGTLMATNSGTHTVSLVDLATGKETARLAAVNCPSTVAVSPDGKTAVVGNFLPAGDATKADHSAAVSVYDLTAAAKVADVKLPAGGTLLRGVAISPDGRWAYAVHTVGRFTLPTTQLDRGWVNTNALSIIDLGEKEATGSGEEAAGNRQQATGDSREARTATAPAPAKPALYATLLMDHIFEGAADPWGVAVSPDGATLWVTLSGVHQLATIDLGKLHGLLAGTVEPPLKKALEELNRYRRAGVQVTWLEIQADPKKRELLVNDLSALHVAEAIRRTKLPCNGPRGLAVSPDGKTLAVAGYFTGGVLLVDPASAKATATLAVGPQPAAGATRLGEQRFHDATLCFQHWLSCATCHPDGRADGLNWDLLNDGMGNPKNSRSMLLADKTPPVMSRGVRDSMATAAEAGFKFILFRQPEGDEVETVVAYIRSLKPTPSPYLVAGKLSEKARLGKALFESPQTGCARCHPGPLYTDLKMYDVGSRGELDRSGEFDNPTLIELWRTAPYMHDGSAATLREVLTTANKKDRHGTTSKLSDEEVDALVEYMLSL